MLLPVELNSPERWFAAIAAGLVMAICVIYWVVSFFQGVAQAFESASEPSDLGEGGSR